MYYGECCNFGNNNNNGSWLWIILIVFIILFLFRDGDRRCGCCSEHNGCCNR